MRKKLRIEKWKNNKRGNRTEGAFKIMINAGTISFHYRGEKIRGETKGPSVCNCKREAGVCGCHWLVTADNRELPNDVGSIKIVDR
jgi:hypothetical protein